MSYGVAFLVENPMRQSSDWKGRTFRVGAFSSHDLSSNGWVGLGNWSWWWEILLHSPARCQMAGGMVRVYPYRYNLCTSLTLDPGAVHQIIATYLYTRQQTVGVVLAGVSGWRAWRNPGGWGDADESSLVQDSWRRRVYSITANSSHPPTRRLYFWKGPETRTIEPVHH